jgi:HEPN domain-containing protein
MSENLGKEKLIVYWVESSDDDYKTMLDLFNTNNYHWALFMGHLVIEKLLKAYFVKEKDEHPPLIHDLRRLGEKAGLIFDAEKTVIIETISQFNIRARYDDYKRLFYNLCTPQYTTEWIEKIKEYRLWIKMML